MTVASIGNYAAVLRPAPTPTQQQLDFYAADCGRYVHSRPFPFVARHLAGNQNVTLAIVTEPAPHLAVLRWVSK